MKIVVLASRFLATPVEFGEYALGDPVPEAIEKVREWKRQGNEVVIVDPIAKSDVGYKILMAWLHRYDVQYTDVWDSYGFPEADKYVVTAYQKR